MEMATRRWIAGITAAAGLTGTSPMPQSPSRSRRLRPGDPPTIPNARALKEGDIVSMDLGVTYEGYVTDAAVTVGVGEVSSEARRLMEGPVGVVARRVIREVVAARRAGLPVAMLEVAFKNAPPPMADVLVPDCSNQIP